MTKRVLRLFALFTFSISLALNPPELIACAIPLQETPKTETAANPDDSDSLLLPDGTPIRVRVVKGFSSASVKEGDVVDFAIAFEVRANGVAVIPRHTAFVGKIVSVTPPRRGAKDAQIGVIYEPFTLPTGETVTLRPTLKQHRNKAAKVAEGTSSAVASAAEVFMTAGVSLLVFFKKGEEQVVKEGTIEVFYLNGPLRISRKAVMALQPGPASGHAYIYFTGIQGVGRNGMRIPNLFCGEWPLYGLYQTELELNPGTYWFSTDYAKDKPVQLQTLPGHQYIVYRGKHGLFAKEFEGSDIPMTKLALLDYTKLTPEDYRLLTADPPSKGNSHPQHD